MGSCKCNTCLYCNKIMAIASKQTDPKDKKEIEDLYERMALTEDDNGMYNGRWTAVKPIIHALENEHFEDKGHQIRKDGHEKCEMCGLLENIF